MNVADIINLGFHGFAFVTLYLGFRLLKIVAKREKTESIKILMRSTHIFLIVSFLFFLGGVGFELYRIHIVDFPHTVNIYLSPTMREKEVQGLIPGITNTNTNQLVDFIQDSGSTKGSVLVNDNDALLMNLEALCGELAEKTKALRVLLNSFSGEEGGLGEL